MQVDLEGKLVVPQEIASTNLRPDIVLWSRSRMRVSFIELTVPWEDLVLLEAASEECRRLCFLLLLIALKSFYFFPQVLDIILFFFF